MKARFAVYLLCFPDAPPATRHYVGITTPDRLQKRLMEHRTGRGSNRTKAACQKGEIWYHTMTFATCCRELEKTLQRYSNVTDLCPRCFAGVEFPPQIAYPRPQGTLFSGGLPVLVPK